MNDPRRIAIRFSRRRALAASAAAGAMLLGLGKAEAIGAQTVPTPVVSGDCSTEPGVMLFVGFRLGLPVMTVSEVIPPVTWPLTGHPTLPLLLMIPPDWHMVGGWADSYTASGMPIWQDQPMLVPRLTLARIVSPDGLAAFEFAVGNVAGEPISPLQAASVAEQGIAGENPQLTELCSYEDQNPLMPGWFQAFRHEQSVLVSTGNAIPNPSVLFPFTTVTYFNMYGPRETYEQLMRTYFIPLFFQFLGKGDSGTPTPG